MTSTRSDRPFVTNFILVFLLQGPVWVVTGFLWGLGMIAFAEWRPGRAIYVGIVWWGMLAWAIAGSLIAIGFAWRNSASFAVIDRAAFRSVIEKVRRKNRLNIRSETSDEIVLGPKWALLKLSLQETVIQFDGDAAIVTGPALTVGPILKQLRKLSE